MRLVYKLLLAKSNPVQLIGFVLANIVGVFILLFGIRAYSDVSATFQDPEAPSPTTISSFPAVPSSRGRTTASPPKSSGKSASARAWSPSAGSGRPTSTSTST